MTQVNTLRIRQRFVILILSLACLTLLGLFNDPVYGQSSEDELFFISQKAFEDGFYDVSIRYLDELLTTYPVSNRRTEAELLLGQSYFFQNQYLKAFNIFEKIAQSSSKHTDAAIYWLGETYLKGFDYKKAEEKYQELMTRYPESDFTPQAMYSLGWVYFEQGHFERAKETFEHFAQAFSDHILTEDTLYKLGESLYNLKNYQETIRFYSHVFLEKYPDSNRKPEVFFYIAESYYYLEDPLNAIAYYAKTAELGKEHQLVLMAKVSMGWSYLRVEKLTLAEKHFTEALHFAQEHGLVTDDVYLGLANLYTEQENHLKALEAYNNLIEKFPNSHRILEARLGKANALYLIKRFPEAISAYQTLIELLPEDSMNQDITHRVHNGLAWAYLKDNQIEKAINILKNIINKTSSKAIKISSYTQIADVYHDANQFAKAIETYDEILRSFPDSALIDYVQYRQGVTLLKINQLDSAILSFRSLQSNFPNSKYLIESYYYLAVAYFQKGHWKQSKERIQNFIDSASSQNEFLSEANYILALSFYNLEDYVSAIKTFQYIMKNFPDKSILVRTADFYIAKCYFEMNDEPQAIKRFKLISQKYPQSKLAQDALLWLAEHFLKSRDYDQSIVYFEELINQYPGSDHLSIAYYELGQVYASKEDYKQAIELLKKIKPDDGKEIYANARLEIADIFSKELDPREAIDIYENIIESSPEFKRNAYLKIAELYKSQLKYEDAYQMYKYALASKKAFSDISNAQIQFYIGDIYEINNSSKKAIDEYLKIPYLYPKDKNWVTKAYLRIARLYEDEDNWTQAKITYKKIIALETEESKFAQERLDWISQNNLDAEQTLRSLVQ